MRVTSIIVAAALAIGLAGSAFAQDTSILNTPHNLNNLDAWGVQMPLGRICMPCHVPHNAYPWEDAEVKRVLWNHEETDADFQMYVTMNGNEGELNGPSKLCLSCHDGVTAIDSYGGNDGFFNDVKIPGNRPTNMGTDLSNDHPIGIAYPDGTAGYNPASGLQGVKLVTVNDVPRVECTSCHEPHNNSLGKFLRLPIASSTICFECHDK